MSSWVYECLGGFYIGDEDNRGWQHHLQQKQQWHNQLPIITETRNLCIQPLIIPEEANNEGRAWQEWLEGIERKSQCFKISEPIDKKDEMIIYGGKEIPHLEKSLQDPEILDMHVKLRMKLITILLPRRINVMLVTCSWTKNKTNVCAFCFCLGLPQLFASVTSPKRIDSECLGKSCTGTRQSQNNFTIYQS